MITVFQILLIITSVLLIVLIMMHKAEGGGLGDMFGGAASSNVGTTSIAERNLDRLTVGVGLVWAGSAVALALLLKATS